ncbi:MAG TPA: amino acid ABC transporter substrate-binding protein [Stellaceae bacterium]|nr:amino acid ABC transporter substrate-binding protein [Stellaceae bacterium]
MRVWGVAAAAMLVGAGMSAGNATAQGQAPIKVGFAISETGGSAGVGKQYTVTAQIWADDVNAKGGLLGRKVEIVHYDDQSNPALDPGIYTKLLDVDKVDLITGSGTNYSSAAMPIIIQHNAMLLDTLALAVNDEFHYPRFFQTMPYGPHGKEAISQGYFAAAMAMNPKPQTVALTGADAEFSKNAIEGAKHWIQQDGLKIVYDRVYPPNQVDFSPVIQSIKAAGADLVYLASYPADSAGFLRAVEEQGLTAKMFGGAIVGPQLGTIKAQMGEHLNGLVDYELFVHEKTMEFPGIDEFIAKYRAKAKEAGTDPLGFYVPPLVYATFQVLEQAVDGTKSLDQDKLAKYIHATTFKTVYGDIAFGEDGEWRQPRILTVQYQGVKGHDLEQFQKPGETPILDPPAFKTGTLQYPYSSTGK